MVFELSGVSILDRIDFGISSGTAQGVSVEQGVVEGCLGVFGDGVVGVMSVIVVVESAVIMFSRICSLLLSLKTIYIY